MHDRRERDKKKTWILLLSIFHLFIHTHTLLLSRFSLITKQQQQKKRIRKCRIWTDKQKTRQKLIFHKENTEKRQKIECFSILFYSWTEQSVETNEKKMKWRTQKKSFFFLLFFLEWIKRETEKIFYLISIEAWRIAENVPSLSILIFCLFIRTKKWHEKKKTKCLSILHFSPIHLGIDLFFMIDPTGFNGAHMVSIWFLESF